MHITPQSSCFCTQVQKYTLPTTFLAAFQNIERQFGWTCASPLGTWQHRRKTSCPLRQPSKAALVLTPNLTLQPLPHVLRQKALVRHTWPIPRYSSKMLQLELQAERAQMHLRLLSAANWDDNEWARGSPSAQKIANFLLLWFGTRCSLPFRLCVFSQKRTEHNRKINSDGARSSRNNSLIHLTWTIQSEHLSEYLNYWADTAFALKDRNDNHHCGKTPLTLLSASGSGRVKNSDWQGEQGRMLLTAVCTLLIPNTAGCWALPGSLTAQVCCPEEAGRARHAHSTTARSTVQPSRHPLPAQSAGQVLPLLHLWPQKSVISRVKASGWHKRQQELSNTVRTRKKTSSGRASVRYTALLNPWFYWYYRKHAATSILHVPCTFCGGDTWANPCKQLDTATLHPTRNSRSLYHGQFHGVLSFNLLKFVINMQSIYVKKTALLNTAAQVPSPPRARTKMYHVSDGPFWPAPRLSSQEPPGSPHTRDSSIKTGSHSSQYTITTHL